MTKRQILRRIKHWQDLFGLGEWDIPLEMVLGESVTDDNRAELWTDAELLEARIKLPTEANDGDQNERILHEMLHLALTKLHQQFWDATERLGDDVRAILRGQWETREEQTVASLQRAFEKHGTSRD